MAQIARRQHHQVAPLEEFREEAVACPDCGGPATRRVRVDGRRSSFLEAAAAGEGIACLRCAARDAAVAGVRWPGGTGRGRELVREVEQLAAVAADPGATVATRAGAEELLATPAPALEAAARHRKQQRGNQERRAVDDGWLEEASRRHVAGEKWEAIAPDFSISKDRLRHLVVSAGLPTRGKR